MDLVSNNFNHARLFSLGYGNERALAITSAQLRLLQGTSQLVRCKEGPSEDNQRERIMVDVFNNPEDLLLYSDVLLPSWKNFAEALPSVTANDQGCIYLMLQ